jgi:hypothetical protein
MSFEIRAGSLVATLIFGAAISLWGTAARADASGGQRICDGRYALCSSAQCQPIPGDPKHVTCSCEGPLRGLNIANSSGAVREYQLTSTFSLRDPAGAPDQAPKSSMACTGENAGKWAFCLDAPCTAGSGGVSCTCELSAASDYYTFTSACPTDGKALHAACALTWSAASKAELLSGYSQLAPFYGYPPELAYCEVPTR